MKRVFFSTFLVLLSACEEQTPPGKRASAPVDARAPAAPTRLRRPAPRGDFDCRELRPPPANESTAVAETIDLAPPAPGKSVFTSKLGVVVTFNRDDFLKAARCLKFEKAIRYVEEETGRAETSALMDAFQLSYVIAALLDAGRAGIRVVEESAQRASIVRDGWADDGCAGRCRSFGRVYRLKDDDPAFFFRVSDGTRYKEP